MVWLLIVVLQVLIVSFAGKTFNIALWVYYSIMKGMNARGWGICILIGAFGLPFSCFLKIFKEEEIFFCRRKMKMDSSNLYPETILEDENIQLKISPLSKPAFEMNAL